MRRREFITALTGATVAWPIAAHAQQSSTTKRIAIATPSASPADMSGGDPVFSSFFDELKRLGYIEGKNLTVSRYSGGGQRERYGDLAREIVATNPDLIYSMGMPVTRALKAATNTIPIVALTGNPVPFGLVSSLAHPGGNITGVSVDAGLEIWGKRLELLIEAVPKLANVAYVATQAAWENAGSKAIREVAEKLGASLRHARLGTPINAWRSCELGP